MESGHLNDAMNTQSSKLADPTRLGVVEDISGPSVRIKLEDGTETGLVFVRGEGYRVGQVGSFVRIPAGYSDLYGIVSQVGAGAAPATGESVQNFGNRWLRVELVGEGGRGRKFERGISQYPTIGDLAHVVTESDLAAIYAPGEKRNYVSIGHVASAESIPAYLDLNKLVTRHSALVGSTGAGKSTTVASLLNSLAEPASFPGTRIVLLDLHGEYSRAFGDQARVFRINANEAKGEKPLHVPYWALTSDELMGLTTGQLAGAALAYFLDALTTMKRASKPAGKALGMSVEDTTADTPVPFCIHKLWYDLHTLQYATHILPKDTPQSRATWAVEKDESGKELLGNAFSVVRPKFRPNKDDKDDSEKIRLSGQKDLMRMQTDTLEGKLRDKRLSFLFNPGDWSVKEDGSTNKDLDALLQGWIGGEKPITVLDLSGIPPSVLDDLIGAVLRILFDALFWGRNVEVGGRHRPLLVALEEAHTYLSKEGTGRAAKAARRIAKEGRKYGVGLMLVSQRPSEIDPTILSQCGTMIAMRLTNEADRSQIKACASDNLEGLFSMLSILRTGEALVVGEAVGLPMRTLISEPPKGRRPDSGDPKVVVPLGEDGKPIQQGGWKDSVSAENFASLLTCWRSQDVSGTHLAKTQLIQQKMK